MSLINFILDIAALLLWLSWRSIPHDPLIHPRPATLIGTVRRAEPSRLKRWHFLIGLVVLLLVRAEFYVQIGPAVSWVPRINLGVVALAFPLTLGGKSFFLSALVFSVLSFARLWIVFHCWLLALVVINGTSAGGNPLQRLASVQFGRLGGWPRWVLAGLPLIFTTAAWMAVQPLLARIDVVRPPQSVALLVEQGLLLGVGVYCTLKLLIPVLLFAYVISSYVYLGASPVWELVGVTSRNVLRPLRRLPLRWGRIDFAPLAGIILVLLLLQVIPHLILNGAAGAGGEVGFWPQ